MKNQEVFSISLLYQNETELNAFVCQNCRPRAGPAQWLVCIHTCTHTKQEAVAIAKQVAALLPGAKIVGTSASAVLCDSEVYEDRCVLIFTCFTDTEVKIHTLPFEQRTPKVLAQHTKSHIIQENTKGMLVFFSSYEIQIQTYMNHLYRQKVALPISGGLVSPNPYGAFVFNETGVQEHAALLVVFHSRLLQVFHRILSGQETPNSDYIVADFDEGKLMPLDHQSAVQWFRNILRMEYPDHHLHEPLITQDVLLRFPMILSDAIRASQLLRTYHQQLVSEGISAAAEGDTAFRVAYLSPLAVTEAMNTICYELKTTPCQVLFSYSCLFRKTYLGRYTQWEMQLLKNCRVCGMFLYAEIGSWSQKNKLFIGSNSLFGLSESQYAYLPVNCTALREYDEAAVSPAYQYKESLRQKQLCRTTQRMPIQYLNQKMHIRRLMFVDAQAELENLVKFKYDDLRNKYNKICLISIEKGGLIAGRLGTEPLTHILRENIAQIKAALQDKNLHLYSNDAWSFFFAAGKSYSDDLFLQKAQMLLKECGQYFCEELNITAVNKFYVVINDPHPLEKIQFCLSCFSENYSRFYLYDHKKTDETRRIDERFLMTNIINDAILFERIVPYFQPIRDNRTKGVQKYEALMRLTDKSGKIYTPGQFLEIAKDYRLYLQLSRMMVKKVMEMFRHRTETAFLNLSAYDISSEGNRLFLYDLLQQMPPDVRRRITFEILESEEMRDFEVLMRFVREVRQYGVKIAIDDFGTGYSNLTAIIQIRPDFIKIDGDLIINCDRDSVKKLCLEAVSTIAHSIQAELIAEHVESMAEQKIVEEIGIEYTQGYYFSKPIPYQRLGQENLSHGNA